MSVFGGDSWGREAQYRKRRVDDLILTGDLSSYRKLSSGKYACLVCPHNPVLDTPLMLSIHMKAKRHLDAEKKLKQREEERQNEMNKRIALSLDSTSMTKYGNTSNSFTKQTNIASKPLIEKTRKATCELLNRSCSDQSTENDSQNRRPAASLPYDVSSLTVVQMEAFCKDGVEFPIDYRERRERELKFTAAGWKRDCHGKWFRDENVEFDSDEEDPNVFFETRD